MSFNRGMVKQTGVCVCVCEIECYLVTKRNKISIYSVTWMTLQLIISENTQYKAIHTHIYTAWFHLRALFKWQNFRNKEQISSCPKVEEELPGRRWMWYKRATGKTLAALKLLNTLTVVLSVQIHTGDKNAKNLTQHTHKYK